ncbi:MAG: hypothetical protein HFJ07_19970 [Lachnospiraceae bacterium]|nr:hypothetical protein [Lachnospiraceae bacterium]
MKKPIVKALACAMALTMALSSPISALATEGIQNIFSKTSDGKTDSNSNSVTNTNTHVDDIDENDPNTNQYKNVIGVQIDPESVSLKYDETKELKATILTSDDAAGTEAFSFAELSEMSDNIVFVLDGVEYSGSDAQKQLNKQLKWVYGGWDENGNLIENSLEEAKDRIKLKYKQGEYEADTATVTLRSKTELDNKFTNQKDWWKTPAYVTVRLGKTYKATATISVKKEVENLELQVPEYNYVKHVIDLEAECIKAIDGNEELTWDVYEIDAKKGTRKNTSYALISKDGKTMTLKKATVATKLVYLRATTESGKVSEVIELPILKGQPVTKIKADANNKKTISIDETEKTPVTEYKFTYEYNTNPKTSQAKDEHKNDTTDKFTWTSKDPSIVAIVEDSYANKAGSVKVQGLKIGKTTIIGTATSGKKVNIKITVDAPLISIDGIELADSNKTGKTYVYAGQKVQLRAKTTPSQTTDKITWKIEAKGADKTATNAMKKTASVNAKALLTAKKENLTGVRIVADGNKKGTATDSKKINNQTFSIKTSPLTDIQTNLVPKGKNFTLNLNPRRLKNVDVNGMWTSGTGKTFTEKDGTVINVDELLTWASNKPKIVEVTQEGAIKALAAGKANVTISYPNNKGKLAKKTVAVTVKQPATSIELNKTDVTVNDGKKTTVSLKVSKWYPKNATKETIDWQLLDENGNVLKTAPSGVDTSNLQKGKIVFNNNVENGTVVKVQARTHSSGLKAVTTITVCNPTKSFKYTGTAKPSIKVGETFTVSSEGDKKTFTVTPKSGDPKNNEKIVSCTANNNNVRIVKQSDGSYSVIGMKAGTTKLTVKTGSKTASVSLTINLLDNK